MPAVFLDRDGVLNIDKGYAFRIQDLELCAGVVRGLTWLSTRPFKLVVISNQSGIARGYFSVQDTVLFHQELNRRLRSLGAPEITAFLFCPHLPDDSPSEYSVACPCRKPSPGMLLAAAQRFNLNLSASFLIGDRTSDIQTALNAGVRGIQVGSTRYPSRHPEAWALVDHFEDAAKRILETQVP